MAPGQGKTKWSGDADNIRDRGIHFRISGTLLILGKKQKSSKKGRTQLFLRFAAFSSELRDGLVGPVGNRPLDGRLPACPTVPQLPPAPAKVGRGFGPRWKPEDEARLEQSTRDHPAALEN